MQQVPLPPEELSVSLSSKWQFCLFIYSFWSYFLQSKPNCSFQQQQTFCFGCRWCRSWCFCFNARYIFQDEYSESQPSQMTTTRRSTQKRVRSNKLSNRLILRLQSLITEFLEQTKKEPSLQSSLMVSTEVLLPKSFHDLKRRATNQSESRFSFHLVNWPKLTTKI